MYPLHLEHRGWRKFNVDNEEWYKKYKGLSWHGHVFVGVMADGYMQRAVRACCLLFGHKGIFYDLPLTPML